MDFTIKKIDAARFNDINIPNEPFSIIGKLYPEYNGTWNYHVSLYPIQSSFSVYVPTKKLLEESRKVGCNHSAHSDMSVYRKEYEKYEVLDELDMTMDDAMYVTREMMDYLRGDKETLSVITEVEGKRQDFFNEQDRFHMREVRDIFAGGLRLRTAALVAAAVSLLS